MPAWPELPRAHTTTVAGSSAWQPLRRDGKGVPCGQASAPPPAPLCLGLVAHVGLHSASLPCVRAHHREDTLAAEDAIYPSLRGRAVLITGGAAGIGASIVEHFCRQGARVAFLDLADEPARALAERMQNRRATPARCSITPTWPTSPRCARGLGGLYRGASGHRSVLVNNAAHDERHAGRT